MVKIQWQQHIIEHIREDGRKVAHCITCNQSWPPGEVRTQCPGIPVLREHNQRYATKTTLAKERLYPPDLDLPDAAYRKPKRPYYGWLYLREKAVYSPLSPGQLEGNRKREEAISRRYGCRFCTTRYLKKQWENFRDGACALCCDRIKMWNNFMAWCKARREEDAYVVDIEYKEVGKFVVWGQRSLKEQFVVTGLSYWPLSAPEKLDHSQLSETQTTLRIFCENGDLPLLFPTDLDANICFDYLYPHLLDQPWPPQRKAWSTLNLRSGLAYPLFPLKEKGWRELPGTHDWMRGQHYFFSLLSNIFDLSLPEAERTNPAYVTSRIVLLMSEREPIQFS